MLPLELHSLERIRQTTLGNTAQTLMHFMTLLVRHRYNRQIKGQSVYSPDHIHVARLPNVFLQFVWIGNLCGCGDVDKQLVWIGY